MFTIMTMSGYLGSVISYFGTFDSVDAAVDAAVLIDTATTGSGIDMDVVPIPDGVTPMPLHADFTS